MTAHFRLGTEAMTHIGEKTPAAATALVPSPVSKAIDIRGRRRSSKLLELLWSHRWFALVSVVLTIGAVVLGVRTLLGPAVVVDHVKRGTLVETVVASGHVESPYRAEIGSQITGTVADVLVAEGERVVAGQPLIILDSRELKSALIEAQGAVAQAESRMHQLKELTLPAARQTLAQSAATQKNAQQIYDRAATLAATGYESRAALDEAHKNLDVAQTQVRTAQLQVYSASAGGSDYLTALTQLNQARANQDAAQSRLTYATIAAPRDGILIARSVERGIVVQPGKALLVLAPSGETQLILEIDERNLGKIKVGQKAIASADAYADQRFDAIVSYINPGIDISRASVEVKLNVPQPPEYIRQDMTVSVDIEVARTENALSVPARAVHDALTSTPWVMGIRAHRAYQQPIKLGVHGNAYFEVLNGLDDGAAVIPSAAGVRTGVRVRPISR